MKILLVKLKNLHSSLLLSAQEKISSENTVQKEWAIFFCLGDDDKNLEESFPWDHESK